MSDNCCSHEYFYLAFIGDCVVGEGATAKDAKRDALMRDPHCEQAGKITTLLFPDWVEYEIGSILDWNQMHNFC